MTDLRTSIDAVRRVMESLPDAYALSDKMPVDELMHALTTMQVVQAELDASRDRWDPIDVAPMPGPWPENGDELVLGYDGRDGGESYSTTGYYRQNSIAGYGWVEMGGAWLWPQPTHFQYPLDPPKQEDDR